MDSDIVEKARRLIANHEGSVPHVYMDTEKHPTIGIGFNLDRPDARQRIESLGLDYDSVRNGQQTLTGEQINALFDGDLTQAVASARELVGSFDQLAADAQVVLIDMVFNMGRVGVSRFQKMLTALEAGDYEGAAREMQDSHWALQVPVRAKQDIAMMENAATPDDATTTDDSKLA
jgi:GH24 family phage-related lysozyme (muramidase)